MKLNFWQWIGLIIFAIALILIIRRETSGPERRELPPPPENIEPAPPPGAVPQETPATTPAS